MAADHEGVSPPSPDRPTAGAPLPPLRYESLQLEGTASRIGSALRSRDKGAPGG